MKIEFEITNNEKGYDIKWHSSEDFKNAIEYNICYLLILKKLADIFLGYENFDECDKVKEINIFIKKKLKQAMIELQQSKFK